MVHQFLKHRPVVAVVAACTFVVSACADTKTAEPTPSTADEVLAEVPEETASPNKTPAESSGIPIEDPQRIIELQHVTADGLGLIAHISVSLSLDEPEANGGLPPECRARWSTRVAAPLPDGSFAVSQLMFLDEPNDGFFTQNTQHLTVGAATPFPQLATPESTAPETTIDPVLAGTWNSGDEELQMGAVGKFFLIRVPAQASKLVLVNADGSLDESAVKDGWALVGARWKRNPTGGETLKLVSKDGAEHVIMQSVGSVTGSTDSEDPPLRRDSLDYCETP